MNCEHSNHSFTASGEAVCLDCLATGRAIGNPSNPTAADWHEAAKCEHNRQTCRDSVVTCADCGDVLQLYTPTFNHGAESPPKPHKPGAIEVLEQLVESNRRYQEYTGREQAIAISPTHAAELLELLK